MYDRPTASSSDLLNTTLEATPKKLTFEEAGVSPRHRFDVPSVEKIDLGKIDLDSAERNDQESVDIDDKEDDVDDDLDDEEIAVDEDALHEVFRIDFDSRDDAFKAMFHFKAMVRC